jgi:hypothetical protein
MATLSVWRVPAPRSAKGVEKYFRNANFFVVRGNDNLIYLDHPEAMVIAFLIDLERVV